MKNAVYATVPVFVLAMAMSAFAQGKVDTDPNNKEDVKVTLSGDFDLDWVFRDRALGAARGTVGAYGAGLGDTGRAEGVIHGGYHIRLAADLSEKVRINVVLENRRLGGGTPANTDLLGVNPEGLAVIVREANIVLSELFDPGVSVMIGANKWAFSIRDNQKALFWDPANSGSITANIGGALPGGSGASTPALDELQPTGIVVMYNREQLHFTVAILPAIIEGGSAAADEAGYVAAMTYDIPGVGKGSKFGAMLAISSSGFTTLADSTASESVMFTLGVGASIKDLGMPGLELFGELYFQGGTIGSTGVAANHDTVDVGGVALEIGAKYTVGGELMPWVEFKITYMSGDDDQTAGDTDCDAYLSYGNHADLMIIEDSFYGFGWNTNELGVKVSGGVALSVGGGKNNFRIWGILGLCTTVEDVNFGPVVGNEKALGTELDARFAYDFSKQVSVDGGIGLLFGSKILEESLGGSADPDADDASMLFTVGITAKW